MIALQKTFDAALEKSIAQIKRKLIHQKFKELGITLSEKQLRKIVSQADKETFTVELEDAQLGKSTFAEEIAKNGVKLEISEKEIHEITRQFSTALEQAIPASVQEAADLTLKEMKRRARSHVKTIRGDRNAFKLRLRRRWKTAFELFDLYLSVCNECGSNFNKRYRQTAAQENDFLFDVLTRLQARGCQIGLEVIALLEGGFADGAHARWRTLHEIACVAMFVKSHGQDVAERYLLHDVVETYKAANQYQIWCQALNQKKLLSSIFRMAMREKIAITNPCDELPKSVRAKIPARRRRNRRLSHTEEATLFNVGLVGRRDYLRSIAEVALSTGMRKGELLRLRRDDLNFTQVSMTRVIKGEVWEILRGWLLIEKTKNGKPRTIPMSQRVQAILKMLIEDATTGEYIFTSSKTRSRFNDIKKGFVSACQDAGIVNLTFHDLRHTWSSRAAEMGVPEHVRRDILGHRSTSMTGDYTHASPEEMERAMELVACYNGQRLKSSAKSRQNRVQRRPLQSAAVS